MKKFISIIIAISMLTFALPAYDSKMQANTSYYVVALVKPKGTRQLGFNFTHFLGNFKTIYKKACRQLID